MVYVKTTTPTKKKAAITSATKNMKATSGSGTKAARDGRYDNDHDENSDNDSDDEGDGNRSVARATPKKKKAATKVTTSVGRKMKAVSASGTKRKAARDSKDSGDSDNDSGDEGDGNRFVARGTPKKKKAATKVTTSVAKKMQAVSGSATKRKAARDGKYDDDSDDDSDDESDGSRSVARATPKKKKTVTKIVSGSATKRKAARDGKYNDSDDDSGDEGDNGGDRERGTSVFGDSDDDDYIEGSGGHHGNDVRTRVGLGTEKKKQSKNDVKTASEGSWGDYKVGGDEKRDLEIAKTVREVTRYHIWKICKFIRRPEDERTMIAKVAEIMEVPKERFEDFAKRFAYDMCKALNTKRSGVSQKLREVAFGMCGVVLFVEFCHILTLRCLPTKNTFVDNVCMKTRMGNRSFDAN